ncbi:MAG: S8 family serine peptidase [Bacteroidales bacterium]|nr:S8 family serine peptidase [Bacteroidales bacterium]
MKTSLLVLLASFIITAMNAQVYPDKYFVAFTDKNNSPYSIENPEAYLSPRAIERRNRFNIPIDVHDLPVNPQYLQEVANIGVQLINPTKWMNGVTIYTTDPSKITQIEALPFVQSVYKASKAPAVHPKTRFDQEVSLNKPGQASELIEPSGSILKSAKKILSLNYGLGYDQINQINGIPLHDDGFQGQGMIIAVLDGGFSSTNQMAAFDSLYMNGRILGTRDFVSGGENVYQGSAHGTAVLSTMGANLPGELIGTAPQASYYLIRTEDTGSEYIIEEYNWASGAEYADSVGADIINSSLGYIDFDDPSQNHLYSHMDGNTAPSTIAADRAISRGMIAVNSAGNSGNSSTWPWIGAPADGDSVFSIGAVDVNGNIAGFSSIGPTYDGRLKPNVSARGSSTVIASTNGGTATSSGTSFSSPIIAGMTACLWQIDPTIRNTQILEAIQNTGNYAFNPNYQYGYGIPDYNQARAVLTTINQGLAENPGEMSVFPNPFEDRINIVYNSLDTQKVFIEIYDLVGKKVYSQESKPLKFGHNYFEVSNLSSLRKGIYMVSIYVDEKMATQKIVKLND